MKTTFCLALIAVVACAHSSQLYLFYSTLLHKVPQCAGSVRSNKKTSSILEIHPIHPKNLWISQKCSLMESRRSKVGVSSRRILQLRGGGGELPLSNLLVVSTVIVETVAWLKIWTELARREILPPTLTRKIIHAGSAPLFLLHWPLFSSHPSSRVFASLIPLLQIGRLLYAGLATSSDDDSVDGIATHAKNELVAAVSRTGNRQEALGGPLIYSVVLFLGTLLFFRDSPVGIVAISQMAAGDGLADIIGRKYGTVKWPFSKTKSFAGSLAFAIGGFLCSAICLWWMSYTGYLQLDIMNCLIPVLLISILSAGIELFPVVDDNISVPIVAAFFSWLLLVPHF